MTTNTSLFAAFNFNEEDVKMNEKGILTQEQRKTIHVYQKEYKQFAYTVVSLSVVVTVFALFSNLSSQGKWIIYGVFTFLATVIISSAIIVCKNRSKNLLTIDAINGEIKLFTKPIQDYRYGGDGNMYFVKVGTIKFRLLNQQQFLALNENKKYCFFYIPHKPIPILLSLKEWE